MNDTLKVAGRIGAELWAAKAEVERLRGLLREACELIQEQDARIEVDMLPAGIVLMSRINAAISQQTEPTDAFTAVDMATAAAQGFRDGQAAVEQAPAQDEREESDEALFEHYLQNAIDNAPEPLRRLGEHLSHVLDEDRWATAERLLNGAIVALTRPAQTEQQPVAWVEVKDRHEGPYEFHGIELLDSGKHNLYAAPIAQTAKGGE